MLKFGETLKKIRIEKNLTQSTVCSLVGISTSYFSQIENSKKIPPAKKMIIELAKAMGANEYQKLELIRSACNEIGILIDEMSLPYEAQELIIEIRKNANEIPPKFIKALTSKIREIKG